MQKIVPHLWFDSRAEEAVKFYASIFPKSKIGKIARYGAAGAKISGKPEGSVMSIEFQLEGQRFVALNGGPIFKFTEAISLMVNCKTQKEIDTLWAKLSQGGDEKAQVCGWLKDKYGLSWQIVPAELAKMITSKNAGKSERMMAALLTMKKLDIKALKQAYNGK